MTDAAEPTPVRAPALMMAGSGLGPASPRGWLGGAVAAVVILAVASAIASWNAQFTVVDAVRHERVIAAIEAAIPDAGALFFACLGIALALHGKRAVRPRALNFCCVAISLAMNAIASAPGWRDIAIWIMPSAAYAVASDTLIGVLRTFTGQDDAGPVSKAARAAGGVLLWFLRMLVAFPSTSRGFRQWVIEEGPVAPGQRAVTERPVEGGVAAGSAGHGKKPSAPSRDAAAGRGGTKQAQMIARASLMRDLSSIPLSQVPAIANEAAAEVGLHPTTARRVLRQHVLQLQAPQMSHSNGKAPL